MKSTNDVIREIFITHGFKIPPELTDMRPYVYEAARALLRHYGVWIREDSDSNRTTNICKALDYGPTNYVWSEKEQMIWTNECPSKQGWYLHICDENDGGADKLRVYPERELLFVDTECGTYSVSDYHSGVINPKWCFWGDL